MDRKSKEYKLVESLQHTYWEEYQRRLKEYKGCWRILLKQLINYYSIVLTQKDYDNKISILTEPIKSGTEKGRVYYLSRFILETLRGEGSGLEYMSSQ